MRGLPSDKATVFGPPSISCGAWAGGPSTFHSCGGFQEHKTLRGCPRQHENLLRQGGGGFVTQQQPSGKASAHTGLLSHTISDNY